MQRFVFIISYILIFMLSETAFSQTIYMKEVAVAADDVIRLKDLINIKDIPENIKKKFEEYTFPFSAETLHLIPSHIIRKAIESYRPANTNIVMGARIAVIPEKIASGSMLGFYKKFLEFLNNADMDMESRVEIEIVEAPFFEESAVFDFFSFNITQKFIYRGYFTGQMDLICEAANRNKEKLLIPFSVYLHRFVPVFKARVQLERGDRLSDNNVIISEEYLRSFDREILLGSENPENYIVSLPIKRGSVVLKNNLSKEMMVKAGENVNVILKRQNISLTIPGKVSASACMGDMVNVKLPYSSRYMSARVVGYKEVEVEL